MKDRQRDRDGKNGEAERRKQGEKSVGKEEEEEEDKRCQWGEQEGKKEKGNQGKCRR